MIWSCWRAQLAMDLHGLNPRYWKNSAPCRDYKKESLPFPFQSLKLSKHLKQRCCFKPSNEWPIHFESLWNRLFYLPHPCCKDFCKDLGSTREMQVSLPLSWSSDSNLHSICQLYSLFPPSNMFADSRERGDVGSRGYYTDYYKYLSESFSAYFYCAIL